MFPACSVRTLGIRPISNVRRLLTRPYTYGIAVLSTPTFGGHRAIRTAATGLDSTTGSVMTAVRMWYSTAWACGMALFVLMRLVRGLRTWSIGAFRLWTRTGSLTAPSMIFAVNSVDGSRVPGARLCCHADATVLMGTIALRCRPQPQHLDGPDRQPTAVVPSRQPHRHHRVLSRARPQFELFLMTRVTSSGQPMGLGSGFARVRTRKVVLKSIDAMVISGRVSQDR